jgi:hypothetical protein
VIDLSSKVPPGGKVIKIKVTLNYTAYRIPDTFQILYQGAVVFNSGKISGSGSKTIVANGSSPRATIRVYSPDRNTSWKWSAKTKVAIIKPAPAQ